MTTISGGTTYVISSGQSSAGLDDFGTLEVQSGGAAEAPIIESGALAFVSSGGMADDPTVSVGGSLSGPGQLEGAFIDVDGTLASLTVDASSGAYNEVDLISGAVASNVSFLDNTYVVVGAGASLVGAFLGAQAGENVQLHLGGTDSGTVLGAGGVEFVNPGATTSDASVESGGALVVFAGGAVSGATVASGGELGIAESGSLTSGDIVSSGGLLDVSQVLTTTASAAPISTMTATTVVNGVEVLEGGMVTSQAHFVGYGGDLLISPGQFLYVVDIQSGGQVSAAAGSTIEGIDIEADGLLSGPGTVTGSIDDYGVVSGAAVAGEMTVYAGAEASDVAVDPGGMIVIEAGGQLTGLGPSPGGLLEFAGVDALSAAVNVADQLQLLSSGAPLASVQLAGGAQNLVYSTSLDDQGDTFVTITSATPPDNFFNQDVSDILIQNTAGAVVVGQTVNGQEAYTDVGGLGSEWSFRGDGDFLGGAQSEFLIENTAGAVVLGQVVGGEAQYADVGGLGPEWTFETAGDYLGDGISDFLIKNNAGAVVLGQVVSGQTQYTDIGGLGPEWTFEGSGDYLGDGKAQFLIENTNGAVVLGEVVSGQTQYTAVGGLGSEWSFVESGDFLGDGKDQFLIQNSAGAVVAAEVDSGQAQYTQVAALGPEWRFVGAGDYDSAGGPESFLIENTAGALVTGTVVSGSAQYATVGGLGAEWAFHN